TEFYQVLPPFFFAFMPVLNCSRLLILILAGKFPTTNTLQTEETLLPRWASSEGDMEGKWLQQETCLLPREKTIYLASTTFQVWSILLMCLFDTQKKVLARKQFECLNAKLESKLYSYLPQSQ